MEVNCYQCGERLIKPIQHTIAEGKIVCSTECVRAFYKQFANIPPKLPGIIAELRQQELESTARIIAAQRH